MDARVRTVMLRQKKNKQSCPGVEGFAPWQETAQAGVGRVKWPKSFPAGLGHD